MIAPMILFKSAPTDDEASPIVEKNPDSTNRTAFAPPKQPRLQRAKWCGFPRNFMTPDNALEQFPIDCRCWKCPRCTEEILRPRLLRDTLERATAQGFLYYSKHDNGGWKNLSRLIRRQKCNFRRFVIGQTVHVFSDQAIPRVKILTGEPLVDLIQRLVALIPYGKKSFSSSRGWSLRTPYEPNKGRIEIPGFSQKPEALLAAAESLGLKYSRNRDYVRVMVSGPEQGVEVLRTARAMSALLFKTYEQSGHPSETGAEGLSCAGETL